MFVTIYRRKHWIKNEVQQNNLFKIHRFQCRLHCFDDTWHGWCHLEKLFECFRTCKVFVITKVLNNLVNEIFWSTLLCSIFTSPVGHFISSSEHVQHQQYHSFHCFPQHCQSLSDFSIVVQWFCVWHWIWQVWSGLALTRDQASCQDRILYPFM